MKKVKYVFEEKPVKKVKYVFEEKPVKKAKEVKFKTFEVKRPDNALIKFSGPETIKKIEIFNLDSKDAAILKMAKLKSWTYKFIIKSRSENGRFSKGWTLVACK